MIIIFALIGIVFSFFEFLIHPFVHSYNRCYIFFTIETVFGLSKNAKTLLLKIYSSLYCTILSFLSIIFIYRYWFLLNFSRTKYFNGFRLFIWFAISLISGYIWKLTLDLMEINEESESFMSDIFVENYKKNISEVPGLIFMIYDSKDVLNLQHLSVSIITISLVVIQYSIMIYCGIRMHFKIRGKVKMFCPRNQLLQKQLVNALIRQIIVPSITIDFPVLPIYILPYFKTNINLETGMVVATLSSFPLMDSLILMYSVSEYRKHFKFSKTEVSSNLATTMGSIGFHN
ncbi:unnamed protein product [Caenorhabditis angaria]|uniref:Seven TM Receptor n=1 Tax=Caenorhabditis angaria TaxID=860376 RepID=A0A9P1IUX1_9PELO|nr:unnamed protein product [Caenorhabditis angaria]